MTQTITLKSDKSHLNLRNTAMVSRHPMRGFKLMKTAYATIKGFEAMHALRKGQAAIFNLARDIVGEASVDAR
jgi:transposase-like protein